MKFKIIFLCSSIIGILAINYNSIYDFSTSNSQVFIGKDPTSSSEIIRIKPPLQNITPDVILPTLEIKPEIIVPTPWLNNNITKE